MFVVSSSPQMRERLIRLIIEKAFKYSDEPVFKLTSGKISSYYFNCKSVTLHPEGMHLVGNLIFEMISDLDVNAIGGLTLGADPIANAVAYASFSRGNPVEAFVVRKTPKSHGTMQWIEGNVKPHDRVVIVEDVVTTGKSTIKAINRAKEAGLNVVKVIALLDRQEGGKEAIEELGYKLDALITKDDVMERYSKSKK